MLLLAATDAGSPTPDAVASADATELEADGAADPPRAYAVPIVAVIVEEAEGVAWRPEAAALPTAQVAVTVPAGAAAPPIQNASSERTPACVTGPDDFRSSSRDISADA